MALTAAATVGSRVSSGSLKVGINTASLRSVPSRWVGGCVASTSHRLMVNRARLKAAWTSSTSKGIEIHHSPRLRVKRVRQAR